MEIKNNMQTVKTRKKKILKRKISRKKSSKYGGNLVNKNLSIRMDTKNVQSIKSFFEKEEWIWIYKNYGYTGDYEFIYFE